MLFKQCRHGIVNADDPYVSDIIRDASCSIETFGLEKDADLKASDLELFTKPGVLGIRYHLTGKPIWKWKWISPAGSAYIIP